MSHKYINLPEFDLVYVRMETHPTRSLTDGYLDLERYLNSDDYKPGRGFFYDVDYGSLTHISEFMIVDTFPGLLDLLDRHGFNSNIAFFAPEDSAYALFAQIGRLLRRQVTQPILVTRDFSEVPIFFNRPDLTLNASRLAAGRRIAAQAA